MKSQSFLYRIRKWHRSNFSINIVTKHDNYDIQTESNTRKQIRYPRSSNRIYDPIASIVQLQNDFLHSTVTNHISHINPESSIKHKHVWNIWIRKRIRIDLGHAVSVIFPWKELFRRAFLRQGRTYAHRARQNVRRIREERRAQQTWQPLKNHTQTQLKRAAARPRHPRYVAANA